MLVLFVQYPFCPYPSYLCKHEHKFEIIPRWLFSNEWNVAHFDQCVCVEKTQHWHAGFFDTVVGAHLCCARTRTRTYTMHGKLFRLSTNQMSESPNQIPQNDRSNSSIAAYSSGLFWFRIQMQHPKMETLLNEENVKKGCREMEARVNVNGKKHFFFSSLLRACAYMAAFRAYVYPIVVLRWCGWHSVDYVSTLLPSQPWESLRPYYALSLFNDKVFSRVLYVWVWVFFFTYHHHFVYV